MSSTWREAALELVVAVAKDTATAQTPVAGRKISRVTSKSHLKCGGIFSQLRYYPVEVRVLRPRAHHFANRRLVAVVGTSGNFTNPGAPGYEYGSTPVTLSRPPLAIVLIENRHEPVGQGVQVLGKCGELSAPGELSSSSGS